MKDKPELIYVLVKQVPNMQAKAGMNPDGTIDRASAKAMMNPFDTFALQAAIDIKEKTGAKVVAITMGPPRAEEVLIECLEHGADEGVLLTDRRLAGSDTLATAYALSRCIETIGLPDIVLAGLQTTDGDTAHVGPQLAERIDFPQITYVERFELDGVTMRARRIIEGGHQDAEVTLPVLMTISNACKPLGGKSFKNVARVKKLTKDDASKAQVIKVVDLDTCKADFERTGLDGSPTIVAKTMKLGEKGAMAEMFQAPAPAENVAACFAAVQGSERKEFLFAHTKS